jgi:CheY-like chemotaxis protein
MEVPSAPRPLILIADDTEDNRVVFSAVLTHAGYSIFTASSGAEAMDQARRHRPTLIVMDLRMPDLDGDEVVRRLNADPATAGIPVVVATADDTYTAEHARRDGFCAHVAKPVLPSQLRQAVETCLERWSPAARWVELPRFAAAADA